jgi:glycosyltransferase involved in cell wall biosynthesis
MGRRMTAARKPRMALVTSGLGPSFGGVGVVCAEIANALAPEADITIWRHRPDWPSGIRAAAVVLRALVGSVRPPDYILFTHVDLARLMLVVPFLRSVPYGVLIYGVEVWRPLDRWRRAALENATAVFAISDYTVKRAREANPWLPEARVVWLGAGEPRAAGPAERNPVVLILGRMARSERYKGHDALIAAWAGVLSAVPGAQLVIAGDGDDRTRLEALATGCASIRFTGFLPDNERERLLHTAAVLVSISTGEGFGLAAVEAAACGLPVIALRGTVTEELFPDASGHVLLDSAEPQALAEALIGLLTDRERARAIGAAGMRRVRDVFTIDQFHGRLRAAIRPLLSVR